MDYKETLNLPETDFPMKANLTQREPEVISRWEAENAYGEMRKKFRGKPKFVFHDGPPYANGHIHMGHALNKILKDFIVKIMTMKGYDATFIPGWDCHGLPIEHQVSKELRKKKLTPDKTETRKLCRDYADKFIEIQKQEFKRLGVFADWDNPYLTMDFSYEAAIVEELGKFVESGAVYKGLKPVHWCTSCKTALAEAEVEYADHTSPSVYVKFPVTSNLPVILGGLDRSNTFFVIWTTTPWTLPANLAICLHPEFQYIVVRIAENNLIVAEDRLSALLLEWDAKEHEILGRCQGKNLEKVVCCHPFIERDSVVILGEHVTLEQGTGCVHTAPGHGQDDYVVGQKYGLDTYNPVDDAGVFKPEVEHFGGMFVTKANPEIVKKLDDDGFLIREEKIQHSYPQCWRCHQPIIFRATNQWFIAMDVGNLREKSLEAIKKTRWVPHWGEERIYSMVENRPDWCISRQRTWGVPITVFFCGKCGKTLQSKEVFDHVVKLVEEHGADFWFEKQASELFPAGTRCACGGTEFEKENDILDVWFDSGVSHAAVLEKDPNLHWPADLYLEGSDQHRGWFHSSLLESVGTRGQAPYKTVLTHGYVVDGQGKKMSKSAGNVIAPQKIIDQYGAEILRLWVASENYREDIRISHEILKRLMEAYRKIRNTFRFLLGNLGDFDPAKDKVAYEDMYEIDRYILYRFNQLYTRIQSAFENFEFHIFYHSFYNFCVVDLSAFYLDILKDRLYTYPKNSPGRRSGQTALYSLLQGMVRLMAPVLSFTAEEIWGFMSRENQDEKSVHMSSFIHFPELSLDDAFVEKWKLLTDLKGEVSKALENSRREKIIGHSLNALVRLVLSEKILSVLKENIPDLKFIFIVSQVDIVDSLKGKDKVYASDSLDGVQVAVSLMPGRKCERCWNYYLESSPICPRCAENLKEVKA